MKNRSWILLKNLLLSTSQLNQYRHANDKKKRGRIIGNMIGYVLMFLFLLLYGVGACIGYGKLGQIDIVPVTCALTIALIAFVLTLFKTNGYLFRFKEYDMLMSLPFEAKTVAGCKFLYMYVKSMGWYVGLSLSMLIGYGIYAKPKVIVYPLWILLSLFLPVIPMLLASLLGFLITKISAGFRKTNIVQMVLIFAVTLSFFFVRFLVEDIVKKDKLDDILMSAKDTMNNLADVYPPAAWFSDAVRDFSVSGILLLVGITVVCFEVLFLLVGRSYREINSKLESHAVQKSFRMDAQKKRSVVSAIAFKEFKRMTGSTTYMTNACFGQVLVVIMGVAAFFVDLDKVIGIVMKNAPITKEMLYPSITLIVYFMVGMVATTAITPSLEGKNYWIIQSLPIDKKTLYKGKMLFNLYLTIPFMLFATLCICISAKAPVLTTVLSLLLGVVLCLFSTCFGCVCGIKHIKLEWENEIEVIKQSAAVAIYLLPNMFAGMALIGISVFLGTKIDQNLIIGAMILLVSALAALAYGKVMRLCRAEGAKLS